MLYSYIKIFFRTMSRHKVFSIINIGGMAIGITCFLVLSLFVLDELGFDDHNLNKDRIYRVLVHIRFNGIDQTNAKSCAPIGPYVKSIFPEVDNFARIGYPGQHNLRYGEKVFREGDIYMADSSYFSIFTHPFKYGEAKNSLNKPNSMVISETAAIKYFGDVNPIGKSIIADDTSSFIITGVMKDFPRKSHFRCNFLVHMALDPETSNNDWLNGGFTTYLLLKDGINIADFNNKLHNVVREKVGPVASAMFGITLDDFYKAGNIYSYEIQPLNSVYLRSQTDYNVDSNTEWGHARVSNVTYSYIFAAVGGFILLIAIFNFMNLTTAISEKRAKEVGIRKALGAGKQQLVAQFLVESVVTSFISAGAALLLTYLVLPYFNNFVGRELTLNLFDNFYILPLLFLFAAAVGVIAGSYPSFYLSSFQTIHILKGGAGRKSRKSRLRSILVIIQFAISITLIIGTLIIKDQLSYIQSKNLGFNKEELLAINNGSVIRNSHKSFLQEIGGVPEIKSATASSLMFSSGIPGNGYLFDKRTGNDIIPAQMLQVDYEFIKTYQIELKYGRYFSKDFGADSSAVVINETMARECGTANPVDRYLYAMNNDTKELIPHKIIGVIKDFNFESLHKTVRPLVLHLGSVSQASTLITLRISSSDIKGTIGKIENIWNKFGGKEKMYATFMNENLASMYETEQKIEEITIVFTFIAIIIACLGLFGLVLFVTEQRTKEIGIRKVLGASVPEIILLLSKEFIKWVIAANLLAWPVAYLVMNNWLQNFAYRTEIGLHIFLLSGLIAVIIALATLGFQVTRAALRNPVTSLRYE